MQVRSLLLLLLLIALGAAPLAGGCSAEDFIRRTTTAEERADAVRFVEAIRVQDRSYLEARMDPQAWQASQLQLPSADRVLPRGEVIWRVTGVNVNALHAGAGSIVTKQIVLEGSGSGRWFLAAVVSRRDGGGPPRVIAWTVEPFALPPAERHRFSLSGTTPVHWLWLALTLAMPLVCAGAVVSVWRGPRIRRRWLWTAGCLLGFGSFSINWSTGEVGIQPLSVHLLSAGALKPGPYAPWLITFGIPVVALVYLARRRRLRAEAADRRCDGEAQAEAGTP